MSALDFDSKLRAIPGKKLLIILDCCHAGGVGQAKSLDPSAGLPPEAIELFKQGRGRALIASCRQHEQS